MTLAIRRCSRVGRFEGQPVEDKGVKADIFFPADSVEEVISGNRGILGRACEEFRNAPAYRIDVVKPPVVNGAVLNVEATTLNIAALKFLLNGHPAVECKPQSGESPAYAVPIADGITPLFLRIEGYADEAGSQLVRARRIRLGPARPGAFR